MRELNTQVQLLIRACQNLPSVPSVALRILEHSQQPETSVGDIVDLIERDPALAAKVLKTVNSPWYGLGRMATTLRHGVALLGLNGARSIALSFSLIHGLRRSDRRGFDHQHYWRRSIQAGVAARVLAEALKLPDPEELFLASLLQDIGMLVLSEALPGYGDLVVRAAGDHGTLARLEQEAFGADHAAISAWLLESWHLPDLHRQGAAHSHEPLADAVDESLEKVVRCVALSALIADIWLAEDTQEASRLAAERARAWLDLDGAQFESILEQVADTLPGTSELFEIDLGGSEATNGILEQAKEALMLLSVQMAQQAQQAEQTANRLAAANQGLREQTLRDPLTGVFNRGHLEKLLTKEFERATQGRSPISVIFVEIDGLKQVNDSWGYQTGDQVLVSIARILTGRRGQLNCVGRYGGGAFVFVLPDRDAADAALVAGRIRAEVAETAHPVGEGKTIHVTISLGHATHMDGDVFATVAELLEAAKQALYAARLGGKNRVVAFPPPLG